MPEKITEALDIGHTMGYRNSSCDSLAFGTTQWTGDNNSCIAGRRSDRDSGQASSREKDILIRIWQDEEWIL